jgi:hypothetical protein
MIMAQTEKASKHARRDIRSIVSFITREKFSLNADQVKKIETSGRIKLPGTIKNWLEQIIDTHIKESVRIKSLPTLKSERTALELAEKSIDDLLGVFTAFGPDNGSFSAYHRIDQEIARMGFLSAQEETCEELLEKNGELHLPGGWAKYLKDHGQGTGMEGSGIEELWRGRLVNMNRFQLELCFLKMAVERARKKFAAENKNDKGGRIADKSANKFLMELDNFFKSRDGKNTHRKHFFQAVMRVIPAEYRLSVEDWAALAKRTNRAKKKIQT